MKIIDIVNEKLTKQFKSSDYKLIVLTITGSHAYGTNNKDSDIDIQGVVIPPVDYILGMKHFESFRIPKTVINKTEIEGTIFGFEKWFNLLYKQNPNILEILWHEDSQYIYTDSDIWSLLYEKRGDLLSLKAKHTFSGYAHAQFHRLDKLNEKVNENPKRLEEFNKFGYSTKNASHLFRLMNMCFEILKEHKIYVMRPERQQLISIRNGEYTLKEIRDLVDKKNDLIEQAYVASTLRSAIDFNLANNLKVKILKQFLYT